eukprot:GILJ01003855.1.p1 GENE.GILJ01003855.1~~GILJ01003855.1.p1  ORF type:complete len:199 (+),score=20.22 GILJ01003855.1:41-637(+)
MFRVTRNLYQSQQRVSIFARWFASYPSHTELPMPALSPTMTQGTIARWKKSEGDQVKPGDVLCEVETDKATVDFEAQDEGYVAKILVASGTSDIPVGKIVAILANEQSDVAAFKNYTASESSASSAPTPASKPAAEAPAAAASQPVTQFAPTQTPKTSTRSSSAVATGFRYVNVDLSQARAYDAQSMSLANSKYIKRK